MKRLYAVLSACAIFLVSVPAAGAPKDFAIIEGTTAQDVDVMYRPVSPTKKFSPHTSRVFFWFKWVNAPAQSSVEVEWFYTDENLKIITHPVPLGVSDGSGGVALSMPPGEALPAGAYNIIVRSKEGAKIFSYDFSVARS